MYSSDGGGDILVVGCTRQAPFEADNKKLWARVESFKNYSEFFSLDINKLACAGFFYTGTPGDDCVRCGWCSLDMGGWKEVYADPFFIHVQLRPNCDFVQKCIRQLCLAYEPTIPNVMKALEYPIELGIRYLPGAEVNEKKATKCLDIKRMCKESEEFEDSSIVKCKVCLLRKADILIIPCSHLYTCGRCVLRLNTCPVCKQMIQGTLRVYHGD